MATGQNLIDIMREDYLDDTFDGIATATPAEIAENALWTDTQLLRYLTEAQEEVCWRAKAFASDSMTITLVDGQQQYTVDDKIVQLRRLLFNNKPMTHKSRETMDTVAPEWKTNPGTGLSDNDIYFFIRGRTLTLSRVPTAADVATGDLELEVYRLPANDVTAGAQLEIPTNMHKNTIWYALHLAYLKHDADTYDPKRSDGYLFKFEKAFGPKVDHRVIIHQLEHPRRGGHLSAWSYTKDIRKNSGQDADWDSTWQEITMQLNLGLTIGVSGSGSVPPVVDTYLFFDIAGDEPPGYMAWTDTEG